MTQTVVHLIGSLDRGGAETVALDLCRQIPPREVKQIFFCLSGRKGRLSAEFEVAGAVVLVLPLRPHCTFPSRLHRELRRIQPSVVVSHVSIASGPLLVIAAIAGIRRRIARVHSQGDGRISSPQRLLYRSVGRALMAFVATDVVAVSEPSLRFGLGRWTWIANRRGVSARVLVNGVDVERFHPPIGSRESSAGKSVLYVGRAAPEKDRARIPPIAKALRNIRAARVTVVGPGGHADLGPLPESGVEILGERDDVDQLMRESDVLLLTSVREGLPGVILEALASGLPVVTSDIPGMGELSRELTGITLIPLVSGPDHWAEALSEAMDMNSDQRSEIRGAFVQSKYSLRHSVREWRELWR